MKKSNLLTLAAVALVTLLALPSTARAVVDGDILLGFRASGGTGQTTNFIINLGQASQFLSGGADATGSVISLGNFGTDLVDTYGASWNTRSDLSFGLMGAVGTGVGAAATFDTNNTMYLSRNESTFGTQATSWNRATNSSQGTRISNNQTAVYNGLNSTSPTAASALNAFFEDTSLSFAPGTNWQVKMPLAGGANPGIESNFANGATATASDLFQLNPGAGLGNYVGRFTFDNSGGLSFQSAAVPEPSTYALLALGGLALFVLNRHRKVLSK